MSVLGSIRRTGGIFWGFRYYIACALVALVLWDTVWLKPFRFYVVLLHELCHAVAALATGGQVMEIRTHWDESGSTLTQGGYLPLVSAAGYVGSALIGAALIFSSRWRWVRRAALACLGGTSVYMTLRYTPFGGLDFAAGIAGGAVLLFLALNTDRGARVGAIWLGTMLCLYSLHDFRTDIWYSAERTDAGILARAWGHPWLAYPIGLGWVLFSVAAMYRAMLGLVRSGPPAEPTGP